MLTFESIVMLVIWKRKQTLTWLYFNHHQKQRMICRCRDTIYKIKNRMENIYAN